MVMIFYHSNRTLAKHLISTSVVPVHACVPAPTCEYTCTLVHNPHIYAHAKAHNDMFYVKSKTMVVVGELQLLIIG